MSFLIDGYNLLHALGLANRGMSGKGLERARIRMLEWLAERHGAESSKVRVVFDALHATRGDRTIQNHRGLTVEFAFKELADDRIEDLIDNHTHPRKLRVISNDTRIQDYARRRGCVVWGSNEYVDWLIQEQPQKVVEAKPVELKDSATAEELSAWLAIFEQPK